MKIIYETNEYDAFNRLPGQRNVNEKHVVEIMSSIKQYGWLSDPIRVTERLEIFDGQHRLEALKRLGMPVEYIVIEGLSTADAVRIINNTQMKWRIRDYTESYAETGHEGYGLVKSLMDKYGVTEGLVFRAANREGIGGRASTKYKEGDSKFTVAEYMKADKKLAVYQKFAELLAKHKGQKGARDAGIFFLIDHGYEYKTIEKAENDNGDRTIRFDTTLGFLEYIEDICNYRKFQQNRIYPVEEFKKTGSYTRGYK